MVHAGDTSIIKWWHRKRFTDFMFFNEAGDSLEGILGLWSENVWLLQEVVV